MARHFERGRGRVECILQIHYLLVREFTPRFLCAVAFFIFIFTLFSFIFFPFAIWRLVLMILVAALDEHTQKPQTPSTYANNPWRKIHAHPLFFFESDAASTYLCLLLEMFQKAHECGDFKLGRNMGIAGNFISNRGSKMSSVKEMK